MKKTSKAGFTLVELLVVIGIIALLISILLPTLGRARRAANTVACAANLRSIIQGMQMYASQNAGAIPGSAHTTARFTFVDPSKPTPAGATGISDANYPGVVQVFDWASPILKVMGVKFEEGGKIEQRIGTPASVSAGQTSRWHRVREFPGFRCPENGILAVSQFGSISDPVLGRIMSYNTAIGFLVAHNPGGGGTPITCGWQDSMAAWNPPPGYVPKLPKIGSPARKIFIADGARYTNTSPSTPDYDLSYDSSLGGAFGDQGAWTPFTNSWQRKAAPGNGQVPSQGRDCRIFAYRHGLTKQYVKGDLFKANFGFYDGHVELLGDLESSRPEFWMPKGSKLGTSNAQMFADTKTAFGIGGLTYIVP